MAICKGLRTTETWKLPGLLLIFVIIAGMFFLGQRWLDVANSKWQVQNGQEQPKYTPFRFGGGDRVDESENEEENFMVMEVRDICGNGIADIVIKVDGIRVYHSDGRSRYLKVDDPEFPQWIDFKGKTEIAVNPKNPSAAFNFGCPTKGNRFEVIFTTDLDPDTACQIQIVPLRP